MKSGFFENSLYLFTTTMACFAPTNSFSLPHKAKKVQGFAQMKVFSELCNRNCSITQHNNIYVSNGLRDVFFDKHKKNTNMIRESELVLAADGSLYHIHLNGEQIADTVILVGDPQRVDMFKPMFAAVEHETLNREIHSITGSYKGKRITVLSTGMGTDNIDIEVNELDAAVNMDLERRTAKADHRSLNLIRLGTSGALHAETAVGSIVASEYALGLDGLLNFYKHDNSMLEEDMTEAFCRHAHLPQCFARPYIAKGDSSLMAQLAYDCHKGITATAPGFYAPQGRQVRLETAITDINGILTSFEHKGNKIMNFEMETSAIYGLSKLLGHRALTLCLIIANRESGTFLNNYKANMAALIEQTLDRISQI